MTILITIDKDKAGLALIGNLGTIDRVDFIYYHDLGFQLVNSLDNLLRKHTIDLALIDSYNLEGSAGSESTGFKIAQSFIEGLKATAVKNRQC